jgi:hypothetical protein
LGFFGDVSVYLLRPAFTTNPAYTTFTITRAPRTVQAENTTQDFDWQYQPAWSIRAGWLSDCGLGVRAGFFQFEQSSEILSNVLTAADAAAGRTITVPSAGLPGVANGVAVFGSPGVLLQLPVPLGRDNLEFRNSVFVNFVDLEALGQANFGPWQLRASAGARYLHLQQGYTATLTNAGAMAVSEFQTLQSDRNFTGAGPTVCFEAQRQIGASAFGLFGSVRGSYLMGTLHELAVFQQAISDPLNVTPAGSQLTQTSAVSSTARGLAVAELEAGLEYRFNLWSPETGRGGSALVLLVRLSAVSQTYLDAGNATSRNGSLSLFGTRFLAGLSY